VLLIAFVMKEELLKNVPVYISLLTDTYTCTFAADIQAIY